MPATYQLRKHLAGLEAADRPANKARRVIEIEAARRGAEDRKSKFPRITFDNFDEANAYQEERIAYWKDAL